MLRFFLFSLVLAFWECSTPSWHRELPRKAPANERLEGFFERVTQPKNTIYSPRRQVLWSEFLEFSLDGTFKKHFHQEETYKDQKFSKTSYGSGTYEKENNWVLLHFTTIQREECEKTCKKENLKPLNLLYHHWENSLVPLCYESNFEEANFGIIWEVNQPYLEDEAFFRARRKYSDKEYQSLLYRKK